MTSLEAVGVFAAVAVPFGLLLRAVSPMVVAYINGRSMVEAERVKAAADLCRTMLEHPPKSAARRK